MQSFAGPSQPWNPYNTKPGNTTYAPYPASAKPPAPLPRPSANPSNPRRSAGASGRNTTAPMPHSVYGREGSGGNASAIPDPYPAYANAAGDAIWNEQAMQNEWLNSQYNSQTVPRLQLDEDEMNANAQAQLAQIDSQIAKNNIQRAANESDAQFAERQLNDALVTLSKNRGFQTADYKLQQGRTRELAAQVSSQWDAAISNNNFRHDQQDRGDRSNATARGAIGSKGFFNDVQDSNTSWVYANDASDRQRDSDNATINYNAAQGEINNSRIMSQYDDQERGAKMTHDQKIAATKFQGQMIDQLAADYQVSAEQVNAALERGFKRLNLDKQKAMDALAEAQRSGNAAAAASWAQLFNEAMRN